ncbi:MAG: ABC transporter substrate-binding protein, partial [Mobilitalea sp.]
MKKKLLAALLVIAMVASMVACGSKQNPNEEETPGVESPTDVPGEASAIDTSEHVVITYMVTGDKPSITATDEMMVELNKILTEKVNAELQIYYIGWTDYLSNYNLTL